MTDLSFILRRTIQITGGNYIIEGSGFHTRFNWANSTSGVMLRISSPQNITLRNFNLAGIPNGGVALLHTRAAGAIGGSFASYDRIWGFSGTWFRDPQPKDSVVIADLDSGDRVHLIVLMTMLRIRKCGRATIFVEFFDAMPLIVEGEETIRDGMIGFESINSQNLQFLDHQVLVSVTFPYPDVAC
jgi:hypothetical protein